MPKSYHDYRPEDEVTYEEEQRETDLPSVGTDPHRKPSSLKLTEDQKRVRDQWADVRFYEDEEREREGVDGLDEFYGHNGYDVRTLDNRGNDHVDRDERDLASPKTGDDAGRWIAANKARAVRLAIRKGGLTVADAQDAFARGRPTAERAALRAHLRHALNPVWEGGVNRSVIADVLGCRRNALYGLMAERDT